MRRLVIVFGALVVAACGSSTDPTPRLILTITGAATYQGHDTTANGYADYVCYDQMTVTATGGKAGQVATWAGGHYTFTLTGTGRISSGQIASAAAYFNGGGVVPAGTQVTGGSSPFWSGPFSLSQTFYYSTPEEKLDSATYTFNCQ